MFRSMRRFKQQISDEEVKELLKKLPRGVLSVLGDEDYAYGVPIDFYYQEEENALYFHVAKEGHKLDAIRKHDKVCFTTWDEGFKKDGEWALNIKSVIAFGKISIVEDEEVKIDRLRKLGRKYYPTPEGVEIEIEKFAAKALVLKLSMEHVTGKLVNES